MTASDEKLDVRRLAVEILRKVDVRKAYADILLDSTIKSGPIDERDRALLTEIVYGTLRWRAKIDMLLARHMTRAIEATDPFLRNLLRVALYQLEFLDKVPNYAAVNEAVELAKQQSGKKAGGFVNGVLRSFLRQRQSSSKASEIEAESVTRWAVELSHPQWLIEKWLAQFGAAETKRLLSANNQRAPLVLRVNTLRTDRASLLRLIADQGGKVLATERSPVGIWLQSGPPIEKLAGFHDGLFQVQGEASQLIGFLLTPSPGERILDACAAPGGKATHLAELTGDQGTIVALDLSARGVERVRANGARLRLQAVRADVADLGQELAEPLRGPYDRILVDAPCSGLGTLRAHPEIKWQRDKSDVQRLAQLQKKILANAASYLKNGGVLVYSTCTITREENQLQVSAFLEEHKEFQLEEAAQFLPEQARDMNDNGFFIALPQRHNTDGFFAARLRKVN